MNTRDAKRLGAPDDTARRRPPLIVAGTIIAIAVPAASLVVAALWSGGWIDPDPNGR